MQKLIFLLSVLYSFDTIYCQGQCNCESNDYQQSLNISDGQGLVTFKSTCIAPPFMGQQSIVFCISNNTNKEIHVYAEVTVITTKGNSVDLGKINDFVEANKTFRTGWTGNLAYIFDDNQRAKYGNVSKVSKLRVWSRIR